MLKIYFADGGSFIADGSVDQMSIPRILKFFATIAKFASKDESHTEWKKDNIIFDAMPKMRINFTRKSCIDSGYQLLQRCIDMLLTGRHHHYTTSLQCLLFMEMMLV